MRFFDTFREFLEGPKLNKLKEASYLKFMPSSPQQMMRDGYSSVEIEHMIDKARICADWEAGISSILRQTPF